MLLAIVVIYRQRLAEEIDKRRGRKFQKVRTIKWAGWLAKRMHAAVVSMI